MFCLKIVVRGFVRLELRRFFRDGFCLLYPAYTLHKLENLIPINDIFGYLKKISINIMLVIYLGHNLLKKLKKLNVFNAVKTR